MKKPYIWPYSSDENLPKDLTVDETCYFLHCSRSKLYMLQEHSRKVKNGSEKAVGPVLPECWKLGARTLWVTEELRAYRQSMIDYSRGGSHQESKRRIRVRKIASSGDVNL